MTEYRQKYIVSTSDSYTDSAQEYGKGVVKPSWWRWGDRGDRGMGEIGQKTLPHQPYLHSTQKRPTTYDHTRMVKTQASTHSGD
jgi:hypothetical protein